MPKYQYRGARASVLLHEKELRLFLETWKEAKTAGLALPVDDDPDFATLDTLLAHVFRWAGTYLTWICEQFDLADPDLRPVPDPGDLEAEAEKYTDHILQAWQSPLNDIPAKRFFRETFLSPWGVPYCVDAMLEHAVMHPAKHRFQLEELMGDKHAHRDPGGHS